MHLNQITQITLPIIDSFHVKLFFDGDTPWMEAISFHHDECGEFQNVNDIIPKPENLMATAGFLNDENSAEYQAYAIYSYDDKVYFLTIDFRDGTYTYDYVNSKWVKWSR